MDKQHEFLIKTVETVSERIQVLALNIAVAAAKMSYRQQLNLEVNNKLSQLVNQATSAVKNMGQILNAAKTDKAKADFLSDGRDDKADPELVRSIEDALDAIVIDSQKIMDMLNRVKQNSK
jgi:predicted RND superfamily exporter protein